MPDEESKDRHPAFCFCGNWGCDRCSQAAIAMAREPGASDRHGHRSEICNPQSAIYNPQSIKGGIAQLVERQLCKLEVRGSNPLASSLLSRRSLGERGAPNM